MKNRTFEILLIILLIDIFMVAVSLAPDISIPIPGADELKIKVMNYATLTDFKVKDNSKAADSLISAYLDDDSTSNGRLQRHSLIDLGPSIKNDFLTNQQADGSYALDNFFNALLNQKDSAVVRVAHYGDSQLEGDRITCYVRNYFQQKFGGSGIGFTPFDDIASNVNLSRVSSPNWIRYSVFHNRYYNGYYGLSGNVYKFSKYAVVKEKKDTGETKTTDTIAPKLDIKKIYSNATVGISLYPSIYYTHAYLMYGHSDEACAMNVYNQSSNEKILSETLKPAEGFVMHRLDFPSSVRSFKLEFLGNVSPDFYGLLIEGSKGVQVDNYSIRGHSGDGLLLINPEYLAMQLKKLNVKLVIFQYGNNVVPSVRSDKACAQIQQMYLSIFKRFKSVAPNISILVIGAGDMASKVDGEYTSYPFIPKIKEAQKAAALEAGCAYWDLFGVMGGSNSILTWTKKGLASHDGHFTNKGQKLIGKELFNALMVEYNQYQYRQGKPKREIASSEKPEKKVIKKKHKTQASKKTIKKTEH